MRQVLRKAAAILVIASVQTTLPAHSFAADTWDVTPDTEETAAFIRVPGGTDWPDDTVGTVDDGQRRAAFAPPPPPPSEEIKLVVSCAAASTLSVHVTGIAYAQPRIIGGLQFDVDGHVMNRIANLEFSETDGAWFPVTEVTADDELIQRLRKGQTAKAFVVGNAADGRAVDVPLTGSFVAIDRTLRHCSTGV
ncbi:hypothetical protein [Acuticoccus yangtzensis]|uniref:hypothetical protein n=1 Tax=Acuticoccus yangtzensis TaxID=1443441 RepID=UPI000949590B|nr:hypothetical protein [Acuticoccus yangtzensis]